MPSPMPLPAIRKPELRMPQPSGRPGPAVARRLTAATRPAMIQVAPGKYAPSGAQIPEMTVCAWSRGGDGTYTPIPVSERWVRLDAAMIRLLGFGAGERPRPDTLLRLGRAGFIEIILAAPKCHLLNLQSWYNHLRRCAEDPYFWEHPERAAEYRKSL